MSNAMVGTEFDDLLTGEKLANTIVGLAGDDTVLGNGGNDVLHGDFVQENLLQGTADATSFAQYGATGAWAVGQTGSGQTEMSQTVTTQAGAVYEINFELAANYGAGTVSGAVEVLWNGQVIDQFDTNSGVFEGHTVQFAGTGDPGTLTFRSAPSSSSESGPQIFTDAPVYYYEKTMSFGSGDVDVKAIAAGQNHIYQVINGKLHAFDPETEAYTAAGAEATVLTNAIGFNQEDDLIYGIAVGNGVDSLGRTVQQTDLVALDASGASFLVGSTPYRSWTADFDQNGNLWSFHSSMDRVTMIDVDQFDANGDPVSTTFKFPKNMVTDQVWDVAFNAATQTFYGAVRPSKAGQPAKLFQIDVSAVADGGEPTFSTTPIVETVVNGVVKAGVPAITFGAFVIDGDGNLYAGGNGGDHDMDGSTKSSGGIYRVETNDDGALRLVLVADAPKSYSNDGALDPRAMDPFTAPDTAAAVLIRTPSLVETVAGETSYDDWLEGGSGQDTASGGFGEDVVIGQSLGDMLYGNDGDDALYGGGVPGTGAFGVSVYDADGNRFDANGNPLAEDDDMLDGGDGDDFLHGSAGHDHLIGGAGNDELDGGTGSDRLEGGTGDDILSGGKHDDTLIGGSGSDTLDGGSGADAMDGGIGNDTLSGGSDADTMGGGEGDDTLSGGTGNDIMDGGIGNDVLNGGSHDDTLTGGEGNDRLDGGSGNDTVTGGDGEDRIKGGSGNDTLSGNAGKDYLNAGSGNDVIDGGAGRDRIYLGAGEDVATGGEGHDTFIFRNDDLDGSQDLITDFRHGGLEFDTLDFRRLDLLDGYADADAWIADNVVQLGSNDVEVSVGSCTLTLTDADGLQSAFFLEVCDGFLFT